MNKYFEIAIKEAKKAYKKKEIPVGVTIVLNNKIIAKAHNSRQMSHNVLGHAEIIAILKAEKKLKDWRLSDCEMYVTLEPCDMCKTIISDARIKKVHYLIKNNYSKSKNTPLYLQENTDLSKEYSEMFKIFFENLR